MAYGTVKVDNIIFTNGGIDQTVTVSGIVQSISGNITATGTIQAATIIGTSTVSSATVTGDAGQFTTATITSGVFASGTAAAPSISVGTTDNGIYSPGADQVAISTNGTQRINIEADGDINIDSGGVFYDATNNRLAVGTTGPSALLDARGAVRLGNQGNGDGTTGIVSTNGVYIGTNYDTTTSTVTALQIGGYPAAPSYSATPDQAIVLDGWSGSTIYHNAIVNRKGREISFHTAITGASFSDTNERARIDSSGRLLVGASTARTNLYAASGLAPLLQVESASGTNRIASITSSVAGQEGAVLALAHQRSGAIGGNTVVNSGDELGQVAFLGSDGTTFFAGATIQAFVDGTPGANDMPGRLVFSTTADGASSPTERMQIKPDGALRYTGNGSISASTGYSSVGVAMEAGGVLLVTRSSATPMWVNRLTDDGTLVDFAQDGTVEGTISVSGTTVSYNGAHLSRWSQLPSGAERTEILRGSVLSNTDEMCEWGDEANEQLNRMKVSDVEGDKNVAGVFQAWDDDDDTYTNDFYCAMTGDFIIRIGAGVTVERGDLLMSAGDGTAKPQDDDIIRSKTIAKVTSTNVSCTYDDGSYCVPCVLMAC